MVFKHYLLILRGTGTSYTKAMGNKRISYRDKHLGVSRTGGVNLRASRKFGDTGVTVNSKHGLRINQRLGRGLRAGWQNGRVQFIGRYRTGKLNWNFSKSGVSTSVKNDIGTFNIMKPNYSSATIFGVQMRGKKAANLHLIFFAIQIFSFFFSLFYQLLRFVIRIVVSLVYSIAGFVYGFFHSVFAAQAKHE